MFGMPPTLGFRGAKSPKLAKITVTQKTNTTRNSVWIESPAPLKQHPAALLYLPGEQERVRLEPALGDEHPEQHTAEDRRERDAADPGRRHVRHRRGDASLDAAIVGRLPLRPTLGLPFPA
jgi:hypothetical protein